MNINKNYFMFNYNLEVRLLTYDEVFNNNILNSIVPLGTKCKISDFAILLGAYVDSFNINYNIDDVACYYWLSSFNDDENIYVVDDDGHISYDSQDTDDDCIRPVINYNNCNELIEYVGNSKTITFGEYPQYEINDETLSDKLTELYIAGKLKKTDKTYTIMNMDYEYEKLVEYEYKGKKYVKVNPSEEVTLTKCQTFDSEDDVWIEVSPIEWIVDKKNKLLISKIALTSGMPYSSDKVDEFEDSDLYKFLNEHFIEEIMCDNTFFIKEQDNSKYTVKKKDNPYKLDLSKVSEEEIIKGTIDSGVAVFLHGPSSEGKSARVKQIDPDCVIIYLGSASPEAINGKSVYNSITGEMIDVKPSWLRKLEKLCEEEPNKNHVVFFDELTNALPSIQSIAFNIVLDREVNGMWKLPENARIVAAGNEMNDSLSANQLAEPLFNRFAHVYIKTTTESWLRWASENKMHPAIYAYVAYKNGTILRSKYDGEKPNADPRKWEMASKMLYQTGNPEMLRALVGDDITKEFVQFCNQQVITLEDVLNEDYSNRDIDMLNTAERYATIMALSAVDDDNLEIVRNFVSKLGAEFISLFDGMWTHGDEKRLERLMEAKLSDNQKFNKSL